MINWKVRIKNPIFISQVVGAIVLPTIAYFGLTLDDFTTWGMVWETILNAIKNPYVIGLAVFSAYNALTDPTTAGVGDSERAMTYTAPFKDGEAD